MWTKLSAHVHWSELWNFGLWSISSLYFFNCFTQNFPSFVHWSQAFHGLGLELLRNSLQSQTIFVFSVFGFVCWQDWTYIPQFSIFFKNRNKNYGRFQIVYPKINWNLESYLNRILLKTFVFQLRLCKVNLKIQSVNYLLDLVEEDVKGENF